MQDEVVLAEAGGTIAAIFTHLYEHDDRGGRSHAVTATTDNLGELNNKVSSIDTYAKDVVLYDKANKLGCSLFVQRQKYIAELNDHDFCGVFTGDWNDKTSSVGVVN